MIYLSGFCNFFEKSFFINDIFSDGVTLQPCIKLSELFQVLESYDANVLFCSLSWSHLLFCNGKNVFLCGFLNCKSGEVVNLIIPDKSKIIQGCCSSSHCHLLTEKGDYWLYSIASAEWKNLNSLLRTEQQSVEPFDEILSISKPFVHKVCCGDNMTIAVTDSGVFSVPLLLTFPQVKVVNVCCGKEHTVLLTEHGNVFSWGSGSRGQLGHGELETEEQPRKLIALSGLKVIAVTAGGWHSCCITEHGDLYSWGWNCSGQLGFLGEEQQEMGEKDANHYRVVSVLAEPRPVDWLDEQTVVKQVACGSQHTIAVLEDNSLWGCGWNKYGQLIMKGLPEKVFGMTKLSVEHDLSNTKFHVVCGPWSSALIS